MRLHQTSIFHDLEVVDIGRGVGAWLGGTRPELVTRSRAPKHVQRVNAERPAEILFSLPADRPSPLEVVMKKRTTFRTATPPASSAVLVAQQSADAVFAPENLWEHARDTCLSDGSNVVNNITAAVEAERLAKEATGEWRACSDPDESYAYDQIRANFLFGLAIGTRLSGGGR